MRFLPHVFIRMLVLSLVFACPINSYAMSVSEAYRTIPHRQTTFKPAVAKIQDSEKAYLAKSFTLLDEAMAARVAAMQWFKTQGRHGESLAHYEGNIARILNALGNLDTPVRLRPYHQLITTALQEQRSYLRQLTPAKPFNAGHPLVQSSHRKLTQAYQFLMQLYPTEATHNRNAFFDHLCALDFI